MAWPKGMKRNPDGTKASNVPQPTTETPVRPQIKQMTGHASETEMAENLPTDTMAGAPGSPEDEPKRKRRTKAEMDAARGAGASLDDPNMSDPRYKRIIEKTRAMGGVKIVKSGFALSGKPLDQDEELDFDDYFYVVSKKVKFDPASSWLMMIVWFAGLMCQAIAARVLKSKGEDLMKKVIEWFKPESESKKETPVENDSRSEEEED
jgi:hypothetical protein